MNNYWIKRFERHKLEGFAKAEEVNDTLKELYQEVIVVLEKEVTYWYKRYAKENGMTLADAKKELNARELKAFHLKLKEYVRIAKEKNLSKEHIKMLEKASIRVRLDRSEELFIQMVHEVEKLAQIQKIELEKVLKEVYESSVYKMAYEIQSMQGAYRKVSLVDKESIEKAIYRPWSKDGKDFSKRIWDNRTQLIETLQETFLRSIMLQRGTQAISEAITHRFNVSYNSAKRLVETEMAYIQESVSLESYKRLSVKEYEIVATLDNRTSSICRHLDGTHYPVNKAIVGVTFPPFHVYCRTTTIPYMELKGDSRASRNGRGKTQYVKASLNYLEWEKQYVR